MNKLNNKGFIATSVLYGISAIFIVTIALTLNNYLSSRNNTTSITNTIKEELGTIDKVGTWSFNYTGSEQIFTVPTTGTYKLEVWGAQGGNISDTVIGGYGGYSTGIVSLTKGSIIYVNVGGQGLTTTNLVDQYAPGGYNGGGMGHNNYNGTGRIASGGGGATHIATSSGVLSSLSTDTASILIVAGGGSGTWSNNSDTYKNTKVGSGGGNSGSDGSGYANGTITTAVGGSQTSNNGTLFGQGAGSGTGEYAGAGGGFYGGLTETFCAGGGSGYIGNLILKNNIMYCYNCPSSTASSTLTVSTTNVSASPISSYAKAGNGFAKISIVY